MRQFLEGISRIVSYFKSHIKYQFFFTYVSVIIAAMVILSGVIYYFVPKVIEEKFSQSMDQLNRQIILSIANNFSEVERTSLMLNFEEDLKMVLDVDPNTGELDYLNYSRSYKYIDNYFFNFIYSFQQIHGAYIYTIQGKNIYTRNANQAFHHPEQADKEPWFQEALAKNGDKVILERHRNNFVNDDTEVISLVRAIMDYSSRKPLGVIVIEQDDKQIGDVITGVKMGDKSAVIVLGEDNSIIYTNNNNAYHQLLNTAGGNDGLQFQNGPNIIGKGKERIYANQNIMDITGWKVITCQPYSELMRDVEIIKGVLKITFVVCLLITFAVSVLISGKISSKLVKMKKMADAIKAGNLDVKIHVHGTDEVAMLAEDFNAMAARLKYMIESEYNEKLLRKEAELNLLQAQINPHFLYNTLGLIKSLAREEGADRAAEMLQCLSSIFRYNLNLGKEKNLVTIGEELENISNYLVLQQYRFDDRIKVDFEIDEAILTEKIPVMSLQPIIENSIIHGFEAKQGEGLLQIRGGRNNGLVWLHILDNGAGISKEQEQYMNAAFDSNPLFIAGTDSRRVGIYNVNLRIKYRLGNRYGLRIRRNATEGVTVEILLPDSKGEKSESC